jgi:hypothetical protein
VHERKPNIGNIFKDITERTIQKPPCPPAWINGGKPVELLKIDEQRKKHIRRDGRR